MTSTLCRLICAALLFAALTAPSFAQTYPSRPITLVVPFAPGGPADFLGRLIGLKLGERLGQQVVIENRASGATTIAGALAVARAKPDGYTLLMAIDGTLVMNPFLFASLPYDPFKDFTPITQIAAVPSALTANLKVPANTLQEVIDIEKAKPGTFNIGFSTPTSQVALGLLNQLAGTHMVLVPYRGGTTQITGLLAGDIPLGHESVNVALPLYRDKKIKIIALTGTKRLSLAPELPIFAETFPGFDLGIWQSIVAPAGTPKPIVDKLHAEFKAVLETPDVRDRIITAGIEPVVSASPEAFAAFVRQQADVRSKVIKSVGMKIE